MATCRVAEWALAEQISARSHADDGGDAHTIIPPDFVLPPHRRPLPLSSPPRPASVPIIDLALCDHGRHNDLLLQMHSACVRWGLFHVLNHGVPRDLLRSLQARIQGFLALTIPDRRPRLVGNHGEGYGTGFVRPSTGVTEWRDFLRLFTYPYSRRNYDAWPVDPLFRKDLEDFSDEVRKFQLRILSYLSQCLGLSASRLEDIMGEMQQTIIMNSYPPCPQPDLTVGIDQHTDVGALTCMWQYDDVVGLHALHDGNWLPVSPPPGSLTIIVADQLEIASNGTYKSAAHRGVLNKERHRLSISSFYQLQLEQVVAPANELVNDKNPPLYPPTQFKSHVLAQKGPLPPSSSSSSSSSNSSLLLSSHV